MRYDTDNDPAAIMARYKEIRNKFKPETKPVVIFRPQPKIEEVKAPQPTPIPIVKHDPAEAKHPAIPEIRMPFNIPKSITRMVLEHYMMDETTVMQNYTGPCGAADPLKFAKKCVRWEIWTHLLNLGYSSKSVGRVSNFRKFDHSTVLYGTQKLDKLVENGEWTLWYGWRKQLFGMLSPSRSSTYQSPE